MTDRDTMQWLRRGGTLAVLVLGWVFIAWQNRFHITAPLVFVCLGYLAVVLTVANLWRTGASMVGGGDDGGDSTWAKPIGALGELEREKRTLLKAIKEAEFDHQMGKLSSRDVDDMVRGYRARAIEVIKELDRLGTGSTGSAREQILREVRARLEVEAKSTSKKAVAAAAKQVAKGGKGKAKAAAQPVATADAAVDGPHAGPVEVVEATANATVDALAAHAQAAAAEPGVEPEPAEVASAGNGEPTSGHDEAMDADSTTAVEPRRASAAKEATP